MTNQIASAMLALAFAAVLIVAGQLYIEKEFNEHGTSNRRHAQYARALRAILFMRKPWNSLDLLREANEACRPVSKLGGPNVS
jgi:type II secretory pathway component PulJ